MNTIVAHECHDFQQIYIYIYIYIYISKKREWGTTNPFFGTKRLLSFRSVRSKMVRRHSIVRSFGRSVSSVRSFSFVFYFWVK
jgi:hypothetical protein